MSKVSQRPCRAVAAKSLIEPKKIWEIKMGKKIAISASSVAIVLLLANPEFAVAKGKKLTLDQAWAVCKAELDRTVPKDNHSARYSAGAACLARHGHRI
jgi:hypothetical protein